METAASKFARRNGREFKENAVGLAVGGRTVSDVSRDLGASHWALARRVQLSQSGQSQKQVATLNAEAPEAREMRRMRQEIDCLRRQRDISQLKTSKLSPLFRGKIRLHLPPDRLPPTAVRLLYCIIPGLILNRYRGARLLMAQLARAISGKATRFVP